MIRHDFLLLIIGFFILASVASEFYSNYNAFAIRLPRQEAPSLEISDQSSLEMPSPGGFGFHRPNVSIIDISPSPELAAGVFFYVSKLPAVNLSANGNNGLGVTSYWINVSSNRFINVFMRANGDLVSTGGNITLQNEKISYSLVDPAVTVVHKNNLTTQYADTVLASNITGNRTIYLKFYINMPSGQPAGLYANDISLSARAV